MPTNLKVFISLLIVLVVIRVSLTISQQPKNGPVSFTGEVASVPYIFDDRVNFQAKGYLVNAGYQELNLGDRIRVSGNLEERKVAAMTLERLPRPVWEEKLALFRSRLKDQVYRFFPDPQASLLTGVTLGQDLIPKYFKEDLISTGTIHVVVVSGYNIALVGSFVLAFAGFLGRKKATLLAILTIVCYTFLVGFTPPTLRAAILGIITLSAIMLGRKTIALYALFFTALAMLLFNPNYLTDISFQLSFLATLGVVSFTDFLLARFSALPTVFKQGLATTLAAQVLVIPILFYYFGTVSLLAPVVNTLLLWIIPLVTFGGFIFLTLGLFLPIIAQAFSLLLLAPLTVFARTVEFFAQADFMLLKLEPNNLYLLIGYYLLVFSAVLQLAGRDQREKKLSGVRT